MTMIWGLDLHEIQWGKFKSSYMFNKEYHLRSTKMIVYQIAMIFCVISESIGTSALSSYVDQQDGMTRRSGGRGIVQNNDFVGIASFNIFVGVSVATIFGAAFFFDLFWPERHENKAVRLAWKLSALVVSFMALADALALTVIVATHHAYMTGISASEAAFLYNNNHKPNWIYRKNPECVASVVFLWPGMIASFASTYIMYKSHVHDDAHGPKSSKFHHDVKMEEGSVTTASQRNSALNGDNHTSPTIPESAHQHQPRHPEM